VDIKYGDEAENDGKLVDVKPDSAVVQTRTNVRPRKGKGEARTYREKFYRALETMSTTVRTTVRKNRASRNLG